MEAIETNIPRVSNYLSAVARNHARILNHRVLIRSQIEAGRDLGIVPGLYPDEVVAENLEALDRLQRGETDFEDTVARMRRNSRHHPDLSEERFHGTLHSLVRAGHIEFHPTDFCDHECVGCYYRDRGNDVMPFEYVSRLLELYRPKSITIVGGGEPTLYRDGCHRFEDLVLEIKRCRPDIQIGLVTKGTHIPSGDWQKHLDWVRLSIDAATPETFFESKKRDAFNRVLENYLAYLNGPIEHVGLGYLCYSGNIHETSQLPELVHKLVAEQCPQHLQKTNIQYRPMRPCAEDPEKIRKNHVSDDMISSADQIQAAVRDFEKQIEQSPCAGEYIQQHTNWHKVAEGNGERESRPFDSCYYSLMFKLFRPTGDVYPCFVRVSDPEYLLGNYINAPMEEHIKIGLLSFLMFNKHRSSCCAERCRMSWLNNIADEGLKGLHPMPAGEAGKSFFV